MRYLVVVVSLLGAGCAFTMHGTAFRTSTVEATTQEIKAPAPARSTPPAPAPAEARKVVIGGVCYAESAVNLQGKLTMVLLPVSCQ